ncbi:MAG: exodeoxyribonuclease VII small subunit [Desulfovibrionaceae bacterium]
MAKKATYEDRLARLTAIVEELEKGDAPLERGVALFKEGLDLARECSAQLETARNEVKLVSQGLLEAFEENVSGGDTHER